MKLMRYVPNLLSGFRLFASPYVFRLLWTGDYGTALLWFAVIGATDGLDGYVARRFDARSRLGAFLDPVADKVLLGGAYLTLAWAGVIPRWLAWIVLGRDVAILSAALLVLAFTKARRDFPPTFAGKLSTTVQIVYVLLVVAAGAGLLPRLLADLGQWVVAAVTAWSGVDYALRFGRRPSPVR